MSTATGWRRWLIAGVIGISILLEGLWDVPACNDPMTQTNYTSVR